MNLNLNLLNELIMGHPSSRRDSQRGHLKKGEIVLALQFTSYNKMSHVLKPKITSFDPFLKAKQEF